MKGKRKISLRNLVQKFKNEIHLLRLIVACTILVALCITIGVMHVRRIWKVFEETSYEYIFDRAQVTSSNFSEGFKQKGNLVQSEAVVLSESDEMNKTEICNAVKALENSGEFYKACYVSMRGIRYLSNGTLFYVDTQQYADNVDERNDYSVFIMANEAGKADELCFAAAITHNGLVQGYIVGIVDTAEMFTKFDNVSTMSVAERYLVDGDGDIVIYTKGSQVYDGTDKNMYTLLTKDCEDDYEAEQMREDIKNKLNIDDMLSQQISVGGQKGYVLFKQLVESDRWAVFYIVYDENVHELIAPVLYESSISIFVIVIILGFMAILILKYISAEQKRVFELAYVDALTSAPNENAFKERVRLLLDEYPDTPYAIVCFDILNFRYINEGYGHEKADLLLRALSTRLAEANSYNETYGRISADRFVGLWVDDGRFEERKAFIYDKLKSNAESYLIRYPIRLKMGIYYVSNRKELIEDMIDKANLARKSVNSEGRALEAEYREQLMEATRRQQYIESQMNSALENHEFVPFLQPKWDMEKNHICGAEALIRWKKQDGTVIPPGDFIPLFEKNGFIEFVDFYMLEEICKYLRRMVDEGREVYPVSINQSRYLMYDPEYVNRVQEIFLKYKVPKGLIELELTETVFFHEQARMIEIMNQLKDMNVNLSIDDFGSGYSSLNLLRDIPFDVLKIDREFLDESGQTESGKWILRKIVEMAEGLNLRVICEGVETEEQVKMLLDIGCKYAQGFLYSRPIPMDEFIEKYDLIKE